MLAKDHFISGGVLEDLLDIFLELKLTLAMYSYEVRKHKVDGLLLF